MRIALQEILQDPGFVKGTAWWQRDFCAHENIIQEGEEGRFLYLIESGVLRVTDLVELEDKRRVQPGICDLGEGDIFGELSLFVTHPRSASVVSITEGRLVEIDAEKLSRHLDNHPEVGYNFLKELFDTLIQRLDRANHRVENLLAWGIKAHGIDKHL